MTELFKNIPIYIITFKDFFKRIQSKVGDICFDFVMIKAMLNSHSVTTKGLYD